MDWEKPSGKELLSCTTGEEKAKWSSLRAENEHGDALKLYKQWNLKKHRGTTAKQREATEKQQERQPRSKEKRDKEIELKIQQMKESCLPQFGVQRCEEGISKRRYRTRVKTYGGNAFSQATAVRPKSFRASIISFLAEPTGHITSKSRCKSDKGDWQENSRRKDLDWG